MKIISFLVLTLFCLPVKALTPDLLELPKHPSYFSTYYKKYYNWFNEDFFNWTTFLNKEEQELVKASLGEVNHWLYDSGAEKFSSFLLGIGVKKNSSAFFYTLELKLPSIETVSMKYKKPGTAKYQRIKWNTLDNSVCLTSYKDWDCYGRIDHKFKYSISIKEREMYRGDYFKYEIVSDAGEKSQFFYTNEFHILALPNQLRKNAIKHGSDALLPLDKIEKSNSGTYIIYYP